MTLQYSVVAALVLAACPDPEVGTMIDGVFDTNDTFNTSDASDSQGPGGETSDDAAVEAVQRSFELGRPFEFSSGRFSYGIALDTMWLVPIEADGASVIATDGVTTIEVLGASDATRAAIMPVSVDGTPGPATVIAEDTYYPGLYLWACGDTLWTAYQQTERTTVIARVPFVDGVFGAPEPLEVVRTLGEPGPSGFGVGFNRAMCVGERVIVPVMTDNCLAEVLVDARTVGEIGNLVGNQVHMIDVAALLDRGELVMNVGSYPSASSIGHDDTVLVSRMHLLGPYANGQYEYEFTLERAAFDGSADTALFDHVFDGGPHVLVESAAGTVVVCDFAADIDFGNEVTTAAAAGPYCLGIVDGRATWITTLGDSIIPSGTLIDDTLWLTTATVNRSDPQPHRFEGKLIGLDPDSGAIVAHAAHRIDGEAQPSSTPRTMVGEGRCAGVRGVGVMMSSRDPNAGTVTLDRVIAGPDGAACVEPLVTLSNIFGAIDVERLLVEPAPGPCAERPHLLLLPPSNMRVVNESRGTVTHVPDGQHTSMLMTVRASDCTMSVAD